MSRLYPNAIRYKGSKSKQLDFIYDCFPPRTDYDTFVDLFGGGGSVILNATATKRDIYNDINEEIVNFFHNYSKENHIKMLKYIKECDSMIIVSGVPSKLYDEYLNDWVKIDKPVHNSSFRRASKRVDVLWIKPNITNCNRFGLFGGGIVNV